MQITRVCIDLDGVLNKLQQHLLHSLGFTEYTDATYPVEHGFNVVATANTLAGYQKYTDASFWSQVDRKMWATCPLSDECDTLLNFADRLVGLKNTIILTSPTLDPDSLAGKLEWIKAFMPPRMQRQFLIGPAKAFCARPETLLIDDGDHNITAFVAAGGQALIVPRPWNHCHDINTGDWFHYWLTYISLSGTTHGGSFTQQPSVGDSDPRCLGSDGT